MTTNREISYKKAGNSASFQMHEHSGLALCIISYVHMNSRVVRNCHTSSGGANQSVHLLYLYWTW
jgi:hypothetical protein